MRDVVTLIVSLAVGTLDAAPGGDVRGTVGLGVGEIVGALVAFDTGAFVAGAFVDGIFVGLGVGAREGSLASVIFTEGADVSVVLGTKSMLSTTVVITIVVPFTEGIMTSMVVPFNGGIVMSTSAVEVFCNGGVKAILQQNGGDFT